MKELLGERDEEEELPGADAFIMVCPQSEFSKEEGTVTHSPSPGI